MADSTRRWPQNVPGAFYVDEDCIDCNLCSEIAPENFKVEEDEGHDYVFKQPRGEEELALCVEARDSCPVESIGDDGKQP
jgi:ferredoxin